MYIETLGEKDLDVVEFLSQDHFLNQLDLLVCRRAGEGELDIFCGYFKDEEETKAIFLSLHPGMPIMLLERDVVKERIENMTRQNLPFDQSQQALSGWPS
ncbi:MAG: hypothetical protein HYW77_02355 [Parcubacteria group bacterium]|nr:hypothetical protein [Parcubacteria group bacterium]